MQLRPSGGVDGTAYVQLAERLACWHSTMGPASCVTESVVIHFASLRQHAGSVIRRTTEFPTHDVALGTPPTTCSMDVTASKQCHDAMKSTGAPPAVGDAAWAGAPRRAGGTKDPSHRSGGCPVRSSASDAPSHCPQGLVTNSDCDTSRRGNWVTSSSCLPEGRRTTSARVGGGSPDQMRRRDRRGRVEMLNARDLSP